MRIVRYYGADHPMLKHRSGDPARGHWEPKSKQQKQKKRRRRR